MIILGIESTCDETSVGIVKDGRKLLANVVASSADMHKKFGGIVPEVAAREQVRCILPTLEQAFNLSHISYKDVDALAIASGPGLIGSLLIGVETAKALSIAWDKPLISVNHLVGHIYANWLSDDTPQFPLIGLLVSGGHTDLILMKDHKNIKWLGGTKDDAAGEVFDKVARVLGLPYPGGPEIEKAALQYSSTKQSVFRFPRPMIGDKSFNFSFSGLKTSVVNNVTAKQRDIDLPLVAYEFQEAICDVLVSKTIKAAKKFDARSIVVGGGVAANGRLYDLMIQKAGSDLKIYFPKKSLSVDNGAMIAAAAFFKRKFVKTKRLQANPSMHFT